MWYKIEEIEEKYGLTKLSIYALITQEPELRQYIKALEGVLQINDEGIEVLLKHTAKKEAEKNTVFPEEKKAEADKNETLVLKRDEIESINADTSVASDEDDLFSSPFNSNSFFEEDVTAEGASDESSVSDEDFFANVELDGNDMEKAESFMDADVSENVDLYEEVDDIDDYAEEHEEVEVEEVAAEEESDSSFADDLIFPEEPVSDVVSGMAAGIGVGMAEHSDDFYSESDGDDLTNAFLDNSKDDDVVSEITAATEEDYNMEGYVKALKEKLVVQNEQIRALSAYLDVSKKMLIQDEKIVNIIEGMYKK